MNRSCVTWPAHIVVPMVSPAGQRDERLLPTTYVAIFGGAQQQVEMPEGDSLSRAGKAVRLGESGYDSGRRDTGGTREILLATGNHKTGSVGERISHEGAKTKMSVSEMKIGRMVHAVN